MDRDVEGVVGLFCGGDFLTARNRSDQFGNEFRQCCPDVVDDPVDSRGSDRPIDAVSVLKRVPTVPVEVFTD